MKAEISIVIPIYNAEKTLRRCIDSAVNQTYRDIEIILVDDGSTDNSGRICDEYAERDARIRVIHLADFCGERRLSYAGCLRDDASRGRKTSGGSGHGSLL